MQISAENSPRPARLRQAADDERRRLRGISRAGDGFRNQLEQGRPKSRATPVITAGFVNPAPDGTRVAVTLDNVGVGNWGERKVSASNPLEEPATVVDRSCQSLDRRETLHSPDGPSRSRLRAGCDRGSVDRDCVGAPGASDRAARGHPFSHRGNAIARPEQPSSAAARRMARLRRPRVRPCPITPDIEFCAAARRRWPRGGFRTT
jgi:hypothetical protein